MTCKIGDYPLPSNNGLGSAGEYLRELPPKQIRFVKGYAQDFFAGF
jgi:hypothetical protein